MIESQSSTAGGRQHEAGGVKRPHVSASRLLLLPTAFFLLLALACEVEQKQSGIPSHAQTTLDAVAEDISAERYEKLYREAAEEWRRASTFEETRVIFDTLKTRLGGVKTRSFHSARGEQDAGSDEASQNLLTVRYQTSFERGDGMETFTLVERDGRWLLAKYFVNSDALK